MLDLLVGVIMLPPLLVFDPAVIAYAREGDPRRRDRGRRAEGGRGGKMGGVRKVLRGE